MWHLLLLTTSLRILPALAQLCMNYGTVNGTLCNCPPGFGGSTCDIPACGGNIFQGSQRSLASVPSGSQFANLTSDNCQCQSGWGGLGCNVCQSASACQSGFAASGSANSSAGSTVSGAGEGQNETLVCNTQAQVYAASEMSCQVIVSSTSAPHSPK
jgi:hypothetical protein